MKISQKLTFGFVSVALLVPVVGYISVNSSQKVLQESIGQESTILADKVLKHIDRSIYVRIEQLQVYAKDIEEEAVFIRSNQEFEKLDDVQKYIDEKDRQWRSAGKEEITPFMRELIDNELSEEIRDKLELKEFYNEKYGYRLFGEVFVTNKYGANAAQSQKTTDYYQADEKWWQNAKEDGLYVTDVEYDKSADIYSTDICVRIDDKEGNFLGVVKAVLNIEGTINLIKREEEEEEHKTIQFKLVTKDSKVIYATEGAGFLEPLPAELTTFLWEQHSHRHILDYFIAAGDKPGEGEELFAHAHSKGYKDFKGLGWLLLVEHETNEIFAPITKLKSRIALVSLAVTILAILLGFFISKTISIPISKLVIATAKIGKGELETRVDINSNDEIGQLSRAFDKMSGNLKKTTASRDNLNAANQQLQASEQQLSATNQQLESEITDRKKAEEKLRTAKREAEAANTAKNQFLANMSHEIRTPMNAIIGFSDILADEELTEEQKGFIDNISNSGRHLMQLIDGILDFSKIEAGKLDIKITECPLKQLFVEIESMMRPFAAKKSLEFKIREDSALPAIIRTDPARLQQCLINLVNNAVKFTEQGHVYLKVSLEERDEQSFIRFEVEDTGIGIPSKQQEEVFELFTQADGSHTRKYGGTGLGLAITKQLAELLGGEITLTSKEGKGSVFAFEIPTGLDPTKQPFLDRHNIASHTNFGRGYIQQPEYSGHVLVAEDVRTNQMLIKSLLQKVNLEVTIVENGKQAVQKAVTEHFDLILMDIHMFDMNGYEAVKALRQKGLDLPIIALTADVMKKTIDRCFASGFNEHLSKPINRRELYAVLEKYLSPETGDLTEKIDSVSSQIHELGNLAAEQQSFTADSDSSENQKQTDTPVDFAEVMKNFEDEDTAVEIIRIFKEDAPKTFQSLNEAVKSKIPEDVELYAHSLKGTSAMIGANRLRQKAYELECAGKQKNTDTFDSLFENLKADYDKLILFLSEENWAQITKEQYLNKQRIEQI